MSTDADLRAALQSGAPWAEGAALDGLVELFTAARAAWPTVSLPAETFARWVTSRIDLGAPDRGAALASLHGADLYLACACAGGNRAAVAIFERDYLQRVRPALLAMNRGQDFVEESLQEARTQLLVSADGPPRIEQYGGRGLLAGWTRIVVVRMALHALRRKDPTGRNADGPELEASVTSPEIRAIRARYGDWFNEALQKTLVNLPSEDRRLLLLHYQQGLSLSKLGEMFGVNKSTLSRRLAALRARVVETLEQQARAELHLGQGEVDSLIALVQSDLELSLGGLESKVG